MTVGAVGPDALIGEVVDGRYLVLELIATGGMASVYRAVDTRLDRDVALKVMKPHLVHDESFVTRFKREARAAARLSHPHIVSTFDQGEDAGRVWLAMEYVPGQTLREVVQEQGALSPRHALEVLDAVLLALGEAHAAGIVHRDVKPENVLIRDDGVVKVADFGLARAVTTDTATSATSEVLGTLSYISPEQVEAGPVTTRSDVYAAGLMLFEMLTGRKAFAGDSIPNVLFQHVHHGVPAPSTLVPELAPSLDSLVLHAAAKDPADRPEDAAEFLAEVRHVRGRLSPRELDRTPDSAPSPSAEATVPRAADSSDSAPAATTVLPVAATASSLAPGADTQPFATIPPAARPVAPAPPSVATPLRRVAAAPSAPGRGLPSGPGAPNPEPESGTPRGRGRILAVLLTLLAATAAAGWYFLAGPGAPTTVPQLVNLSSAQAVAALDKAHLDARETQEFSETIAKGIVISSTPGAGASLGRGADVTLVISKGKERYAVPELLNINQKTATTRLAKVNLEVGPVTTAFSDSIEKGRVISADPPSGTLLKRGSKVALVISGGPQPFDVPDFRGLTPQAAQDLAQESDLVLQIATERVFSTDYDKGTVATQAPADGQVVRGDTIELQISKGPELVKVPSVFQKSSAQAVAILEAAGFEVKVNRFLGAPLDICTGQTPSGGQFAPKGSVVTITIV